MTALGGQGVSSPSTLHVSLDWEAGCLRALGRGLRCPLPHLEGAAQLPQAPEVGEQGWGPEEMQHLPVLQTLGVQGGVGQPRHVRQLPAWWRVHQHFRFEGGLGWPWGAL